MDTKLLEGERALVTGCAGGIGRGIARALKAEGATVLGSDSKKLGDVSRVLMKPEDKTIDRLVIRSGGVLGMGGHLVALPIDAFSWDADAAAFKVGKTADDLKSMTEWQEPGTAATSSTGSSTPPAKPIAPTRSGDSER